MRNFARIFFFFLLFTTTTAYSQVKYVIVHNNTEEPIYCSVMYCVNTPSFFGKVSEGWWRINPHGSVKIKTTYTMADNTSFYIHAHSQDQTKEWDNYDGRLNPDLLIDWSYVIDDKFCFLNCTNEYIKSGNPKAYKVIYKHCQPEQERFLIVNWRAKETQVVTIDSTPSRIRMKSNQWKCFVDLNTVFAEKNGLDWAISNTTDWNYTGVDESVIKWLKSHGYKYDDHYGRWYVIKNKLYLRDDK